ncbi:MAG: hypothetical protein J5977_06175 [Fibrobacter sp.]|nr:hypothetical protein [Fibrobacter sp.]
MNKFLACSLVGMLSIAFVACSGKSSTTNGFSLPDEVANKDALEFYECNDGVIGERVYVTDIAQYYECDGDRWFKSYDQARSSSSSARSSSGRDEERTSSSDDWNDEYSSEIEDDEVSSSSTDPNKEKIVYPDMYEWIDGKIIFPSGTFDCDEYDCVPTDSLPANKIYGEFLDDRDNRVYKVAKVGRQVWFAQNLRFKEHCRELHELAGCRYTWCGLVGLPDSLCSTNFLSNISDINHQGLCPEGWHIPNKKEFQDLTTALDSANMSKFALTPLSWGWVELATATEYSEYEVWYFLWDTDWDRLPSEEAVSKAGGKGGNFAARCVLNSEYSSKTGNTSELLPKCDKDNEGVMLPKDTMDFVCENELWRRATDEERDIYGEICTNSDIGKIIEGHHREDKKFACSKNGWVDMRNWSWDLPKEIWLNPDKEFGTLVDKRDGKVYKTIQFDGETWMAENLNYADSIETPSLKGNTRCHDDIDEHCDVGGRLYTWAAAIDSVAMAADPNSPLNACDGDTTCLRSAQVRGVCPEGWHLPNYRVWDDFSWYAYVLKTKLGWYGEPRMCMINIKFSSIDGIGFSALPVGYYNSSKEEYDINGAFFWSSTESDSLYAHSYWLRITDCEGYHAFSRNSRNDALSIRCIKDKE